MRPSQSSIKKRGHMHKQLIRTLACIFLVCLIFQPLPVSARSMADLPKGTILYVKPSGVGDCSSWANACKLYTALAAANPTDQVWVAAGTHKPKTADPDTRLYTFLLESGVAIYGGFAGTGPIRPSRLLHLPVRYGERTAAAGQLVSYRRRV